MDPHDFLQTLLDELRTAEANCRQTAAELARRVQPEAREYERGKSVVAGEIADRIEGYLAECGREPAIPQTPFLSEDERAANVRIAW